MTEVIKIGLFAIVTVLLAGMIKPYKPEYSMLFGLAVGVILLCRVIDRMGELMGEFMRISQYLEQGQWYLKLLFKVTGIAYISEFSAAVCKDAGHTLAAKQVEVLGKLVILLTGMPVFLAVIEKVRLLTGS